MSTNFKKINEKRKEDAEKAAAFDAIQSGRPLPSAPPSQDQVTAMMKRFRYDPEAYVYEFLRIHKSNQGYKLTSQQAELLKGLGRMVRYNYAANAVFNKRLEAMPEEVKDLKKMTGINCMAGVGVGKDAIAALIILWMLDCFTESTKIFCLAPRQEHLKTVLWPEVRLWANLRQANGEYCYLGRENLILEAEQISRKNHKGEKVAFCSQLVIPKSTDPDELKAMLSGRHADNMLFIIDEASAIPDAVIDPLENTCTNFNNFIIAIFNPRRNKGWAIEKQNSPKWLAYNWSQENCELITPERLVELEDKYGGKHTDGYRVNVLGLPPIGGDEDVLIPYSAAIDAVMRDRPDENTAARLLGCDIARGGPDDIILTVRQGYVLEKIIRCPKMDGVDCADHIIEQAELHDIDAIFIDSAGVGGPVFDMVRRRFRDCFAVNTGERAFHPERFCRLRDELIWRCREWVMSPFACIPDDKELIAQMTDIHYETESGKVKVDGKKIMKRNMGGSPDEFESLYLTFFKNEGRFKLGQGSGRSTTDRDQDPYMREYLRKDRGRVGKHRWMTY